MKTNLTKKVGLLFLVISFLFSSVYSIPARALGLPTLLSPANVSTVTADTGDTPPLGIPEFKWTAVPGATWYRLEISGDVGFTSTIVSITTQNTTFTPTNSNVFADGVWYWHVRVEAPSVDAYTSPWSFTKRWATVTNTPTLISPANSATINFYDSPVFSWSPVMGAARYWLQIYANPGGWSTLLYNIITLSTTYQPIAKLTDGNYYWRVVPLDPGDHQGTPSQEHSFTASYNVAPDLGLLAPNDFANPTFTPTFRWKAVRGGQYYRLQYSTDPTFNTNTTTVDTYSTTFTPTTTLPNDVDYYWRVKAISGVSVSAWTPSRTFRKKWYIKPVLLTPTNLYQNQRFPVFSWTPIPGADFYKFEMSTDSNFTTDYDVDFTTNTFYTPKQYLGATTLFYWRVTPYDGNNNAGVASNSFSYISLGASKTPQQVYPLYYYTPDSYSGFPGVTTNPHEDRSVPLPIFIWNRVYNAPSDSNPGKEYANAYRLQVSVDPLFDTVNWSVDTQNTVAAPTVSNPFTPSANTTYFWRVCPLISGVCALIPSTPDEAWSQVWKTRFNSSKGLTPTTAGVAPQLIRPTNSFEYAEQTPPLEWFPVSGATSYDVQISADSAFTALVDSATVSNPIYVPTQSFAQRKLGAVNFGIYYWRVRQSSSGAWSETRHFQIAAQSQWQSTRTPGDVANQLQIGSDPASDVSADYDLTDLNSAQESNFWYFGFHVPSAPTQDVTYALYLDLDHLDHLDGSGATFDAFNPPYNVTTISTYQPEYAIYILQQAGLFSAAKVRIYRWTGSEWDTVQTLNLIGGSLNFNAVTHYVEIKVPNTAIGYQDTTGSYAASLFSLPAGGSGTPQDSVPSDPAIPGAGPISRFSNVTERMNLTAPPNNANDTDPSTYSSILPFFWDWPILSPWSGAVMNAYLDPQFTTQIATYTLTSDTAFYAQTTHAWLTDFQGDNTYYWRIQPKYLSGGLILGAWSQGWSFERKGFVPQNLQTSVTFATPTFSWDMVEGAESYELQVDDDPGFNSPAIGVNTRANSFTNAGYTLPSGFYYWRVRALRGGNIVNSWTSSQTFNLVLPVPTGLTPSSGTIVASMPTLCWTPLINNSPAGDPVLAAWQYYVLVSKDPTFSTIYDSATTEQSCWTSSRGYDDGQYYWRVAMVDGNGRAGNYTANQTFTKQYPITTLVSPTSGSNMNTTPTFIWTPVNGAATYRFESSLSPTFVPTYEAGYIDNTRYTPWFTYPTGTYYWRVAIMDKDGKLGPFNTATIIIGQPPTPTVTPTPAPSTATPTPPSTVVTLQSVGPQDGYVLESSETSGKGSAMNSSLTTIYLGDNATKKQFRAILSFNTGASLPDNAAITAITLKFKQQAIIGGGNPVSIFHGFMLDIQKGIFGTAALQTTDFQALASKSYGPFTTASVGGWYSFNLTSANAYINKLATSSGLTQIRVRFSLDDNNNRVANYLSIFSGDSGVINRPQLIITYH